MIAAAAWRPDAVKTEAKFRLGTVSFSMLLVWWVFLYAFIVVPHQYVVLNLEAYDRNYLPLYDVENILLLVTLLFAGLPARARGKNFI